MSLVSDFRLNRYRMKLMEIESRIKHIESMKEHADLQWWTKEQYTAELINLRVKQDLLIFKINRNEVAK